MKVRILALIGVVLVLAVAAVGVSVAQGPRLQTGHTRSAAAGPGRERHPALIAALRSLERAKVALQRADRDFGGHRAKALAHTDEAIEEVKAALAYDRR